MAPPLSYATLRTNDTCPETLRITGPGPDLGIQKALFLNTSESGPLARGGAGCNGARVRQIESRVEDGPDGQNASIKQIRPKYECSKQKSLHLSDWGPING